MGESKDVKLKSKADSRRSHREKERDRDREVDGEKARHRNREKARDRDVERRRSEREKSVDDKRKEKENDGERDRDKRRDRKRGREEGEGKEREQVSEREREKEREREREREKRGKDKERERERRERVRREHEKEKEREEREKEKRRERRRREAESDDSGDETWRSRDRKIRRRDGDLNENEQDKTKSHRHGEDTVGRQKKRSDSEHEAVQEKPETKEHDLEEEQRRLDDEMDQRRKRVQEWRELKKKKDGETWKELGEENAEQHKASKNWTLEGESDDEGDSPGGEGYTDRGGGAPKPSTEADDFMAVDSEDGNPSADGSGALSNGEEEEVDPLDAFMNSMILPEVERLNNAVLVPEHIEGIADHKRDVQSNGGVPNKKDTKKLLGRIMPDEDSDQDYEDIGEDGQAVEDEDDDEFMKRVKKTKAEKLAVVDHSKIDYIDFRKNFYIQVKDILSMTADEVLAYREEMELKVGGKDVPKPIKTWHQTGLTTKVLEVIRKMKFEKPLSIQAQTLPVIMSGRDCIGIAKTGSGKTMAFVLPMLRHIKDQPPLMSGDGPIALIMVPTRELVQQIYRDIKKFTKVMNLTCVPVYGGSGVAQQIGELKKGAEIVVCTPGRMIDILSTGNGKITNLRRVTYLVMDEADRMFDMGFESQITRIVQNIRPDRQTVLFSATFPHQVEILAKKVLNKPVEIQVGGRSVVNKDITQMVEVRPESDRYLRLLEILGEWYDKGKVLIFVQKQDECDTLFRNLLKSGYPCLTLHGGKDQADRESTLADFKSNVCNLLVATSLAARGLDVKELEIVINYDVPNHYEEYVHRVGRTGRAGRKGHAVTIISEKDAKYAPDLVKALQLSSQPVPEDLKALSDGFMAKVKQGLEQSHGTGYGGSGFKFDEQEDEAQKAAMKAQAKAHGFEVDKSDSEDEDDEVCKRTNVALPNSAQSFQETGPSVVTGSMSEFMTKWQKNLAKLQQDAMGEHYEAELEINEFPQNARWRVTHKETLGPISEWTGASITIRGQFFPPGRNPAPGERKLHLFIEGHSEHSVKTAKAELKRVLENITSQAISLPGGSQPGR